MDDDSSEAVNELQSLIWAVPISRDLLLRVVEREGMPLDFRDRGRRAAGQLTDLFARLQGLTAGLADLGDLPASLTEGINGLRRSVTLALQDVDLLIGDLTRLVGEPEEGDEYAEVAN
ncbi:MAG TPA: hypothetical protein VF173_29525 [Thermoanaerobaculia bacterium]|nr:hypothetical protein [Thermoanaerobaculia bacterium]